MKNLSVLLKTGDHCIQTAARNEFRRITDIILESEDDTLPPDLAEQIELLTEFLEKSDFNRLRASDDRLSGAVEAICVLTRDESGKPVLNFRE